MATALSFRSLSSNLEEHPVIEGYCYVPLHVAILVHIFLTMKGALPTTPYSMSFSVILYYAALPENWKHMNLKVIHLSPVH